MALWWPGPWGPMTAVDPKVLKGESPHADAIQQQQPDAKPRRRRTVKASD